MVLTDADHPRQTFVRDETTARRDGVDHILVSLELTTGIQVETSRGQEMVPPGRVTLFDLARPATKLAFPGRTVCLAMSRDLIEEALPSANVHGLTLGPLGRLMADHLRSLAEHGSRIDVAATALLTLSTVQLLAACVRPSAGNLEQARPLLTLALMQRAKRYVRANCCDPALSPEKVAAQIGASRTTLYRAFQLQGGISEYIRLSRLDSARAALTDKDDPRRIGEIAYAHGFANEAQFSRAIRSAFGASPRELRHDGRDFRSGYTPEAWGQRHWIDVVAPAPKAQEEAVPGGAPTWRPGAAAAMARALNESRAA
jgi:AraC-like DNA-binding protein